ncbi:carboxypeptidase-like regulatory domain-containing protein [Flagellimonas sp. SN16]|uniref:carboxypeptidase-like regulatory domain-containing protein n=1 Tax=Flagellimonas sp. SN16 TaxID=3415142 RepID=UPI0025D3409E|nr:carboxypeptidase-like regulatory domain-containing protein [Allomuricauda sp.]
MLKATACFLFFLNGYCHAQLISGHILSKDTNEPIPYANVVFQKARTGTYSDTKGFFQIYLSQVEHDTMIISSIGHRSEKIPVKIIKDGGTYNYSLDKAIFDLQEVVVVPGTKLRPTKVLLGPEKEGNIGVSPLIGLEYCSFIENRYDRSVELESIIVKLKKRKKTKQIADIRVKIYEYDPINDRPGKSLLNESMIIAPKNSNYTLKVNVSNKNITIPKEGICVGVEFINGEENFQKNDKIGPLLRYSYSDGKQLKTWTNYHNVGWKNGVFQYRNHKKAIPLINVEATIYL